MFVLQRTTFVLLLPSSLIAAFVVSAAASCNPDAPGNCTFRGTFCNPEWTAGNWSHTRRDYTYLSNRKLTGSLTSRFACVNSSVSHCLKFQYYLRTNNNNDYTLKVSILHLHNESKIQLWTNSTKVNRWKNAEIAVRTNSTFQLIIEGTRRRRQVNQHVRVRDLTYERHSCSNETTPVTTVSSTTTYSRPATRASTSTTVPSSPGSPPSTATRTVTSTLTTTVPSTLTTTVPSSQLTSRPTLLPSSEGDTTSGHQVTDSTSSVLTFSTTSTAKNTGGFRGDADSSATDTGVIVGVVLAVIIVVCLVVVLLVIFRWKKRLLCWTMCSESKETAVQFSVDQGEDAFAHVTAATKDGTNYTELDVADVTPPNRYSCLEETRMSQVSMENYSVIKDTDKDQASFTKPGASSPYDLAKPVPLSTPNGLDNPGYRGALEDHYEIGDMDHVLQHQDEPEADDYNHICFDERGRKASEESTYSNQTLYDHVQRTNKPNTKAKPMFNVKENDRTQQRLPDRTLEGKTLQESQTEVSSVYYIPEEKTPQNPRVKPPHVYQVPKNQIVENSTGQEPETQATSVYHILQNGATPQLKPGTEATTEFHIVEDTTPPQVNAEDTSVYHILETETPNPPPQTTENYYLNLEETLKGEKSSHDSRDIIHKSSQPTKLESSPFPDEPETDYNRLHFDRNGMSSASAKERENGGDEVYSHLKEGGDDTYDEVRRDRKRDVIDDDYYHI